LSEKIGKKREMRHIFWQLFKGYWGSEEKWKARIMLTVVILLNFAAVGLLVLLNNWYNDFYNALQAYQVGLFWPLIGKFTFLAFFYIFIAVYAIYLRQMLQIKWRTWMTDRYLGRWMAHQSYYRMQVLENDTDNPDQRISEDINQFVNLTLTLLVGFLKQVTTLAAFAVVLWNLSGVLTVPFGGREFQIYGYMLWFSVLYSTIGTYLAHLVGRKLIGLNYEQQRYEADFRFNMMRVRENSESVAFYGGEKPENDGFKEHFARVIKNYWGLIRQTKLLNFYVNGYGQLALIVPIIMAAPRYFSGAMQLGGFMQTLTAFGHVQDALSYFINAYDSLAQLAAVIRRLGGFTAHMAEVEALPSGVEQETVTTKQMGLAGLDVVLPDGRVLVSDCSLELEPGSATLITGPSGAGKSTMLRTLAGIWPFGKGRIEIPAGAKVLFLPQRPYLPLGSLRRAICYPMPDNLPDDKLRSVLAKVGMSALADKLDDMDDWSRILSLGEQQRIAFARVLLVQPDWVFMDEATSALDELREKELYELLRQELPAAGIVSVGHRATLFARHDTEIHLEGNGNWEMRPI
jgi:putative ATP-binding cassette transporter